MPRPEPAPAPRAAARARRGLGPTTRSVLTAVLATLVAVSASAGRASHLGTGPLLVSTLVLVVALAVGWPRLLHLRPPGTAGFVVALTGVAAVGVVAATPDDPVLRNLPYVVAIGVLLAFVSELVRTDGRPALVENLSGVVSGVVVAVACSGWLAAGRTEVGTSLVVCTAAALAVAAVVCAAPLGGWVGHAIATALATATGGVIAALLPQLDLAPGLACGILAGVLVTSLDELLGHLPVVRGFRASLAAAVLPVAAGGVLVLVVAGLVG